MKLIRITAISIITLSLAFACSSKKSKEKIKTVKEAEVVKVVTNDTISLPSGLKYRILKEGIGKKAKITDKVRVHYHGTLDDGTVFDSSIKRGTPITFPLNRVIKGWQEGLQLMNAGSIYELYIPSKLGYGSRGAGKIPPFAHLTFRVELLEIL